MLGYDCRRPLKRSRIATIQISHPQFLQSPSRRRESRLHQMPVGSEHHCSGTIWIVGILGTESVSSLSKGEGPSRFPGWVVEEVLNHPGASRPRESSQDFTSRHPSEEGILAFRSIRPNRTSPADSVSGLACTGRGDRPLEGTGGQAGGKFERARDDEAPSGVGEQTRSPRDGRTD